MSSPIFRGKIKVTIKGGGIVSIERVPGRAVEDVRDWVREQLEHHWAYHTTESYEDSVERGRVMEVKEAIMLGDPLTREEAKWLETQLTRWLNNAVYASTGHIQSANLPIHKVDEWGIYSDAYYLYCRPGTYVD